MARIEGGCLCGNIRYLSEAEPTMVAACHCKNCQRQSGSAFSVNVAVSRQSLQMTGGDPAVYEDRGESGQSVWRQFCPRCGSPLLSRVDAMPDTVFVKAGTLDDTSWIKPQMNLWCASAQEWVELDPAVPGMDRNPPF